MRKRGRKGEKKEEGKRGKDLTRAWLLNIYIKLLADHLIPGEVIPFLPHLQVTAVAWHSFMSVSATPLRLLSLPLDCKAHAQFWDKNIGFTLISKCVS